MGKFYALIRRTDFTDLFKYGEIFLNGSTIVAVNDESEAKDGDMSILSRLFKNANSFESSFTYLIIKFNADNLSSTCARVNIEDVTNVYPLDFEAKKELETSFDIHIRLDNPIWADSFFKIQQQRTKRACEKGALNLWKLFKPLASIDDCKHIITEDILDEVVAEVYENRRPSGDVSIWVYLLRYERHAYYPQETVGFFMDAVNVVCNYLSKREVDEMAVNRTAIWSFLNELPRNLKMKEIVDKMETSESTISFMSKISEIENRVDFLKVAVAFLIFKNRYRDGLRYDVEYFKWLADGNYTKDYYGLILYLLGLVLGHDKTYECLYENLPLPIYKCKEEMESIRMRQEYERKKAALEMQRFEEEQQRQRQDGRGRTGKKGRGFQSNGPSKNHSGSIPFREGDYSSNYGHPESKVEKEFKKTPVKESNAYPTLPGMNGSAQSVNEPDFPCKMGKLKTGSRSEIRQKPKPRQVNTLEEYYNLLKDGWTIINK